MARLGIKSTSSPFDYTKLIAPLEKQVEEYDKNVTKAEDFDSNLYALDPYIKESDLVQGSAAQAYKDLQKKSTALVEKVTNRTISDREFKSEMAKLNRDYKSIVPRLTTQIQTRANSAAEARKYEEAGARHYNSRFEDMNLSAFDLGTTPENQYIDLQQIEKMGYNLGKQHQASQTPTYDKTSVKTTQVGKNLITQIKAIQGNDPSTFNYNNFYDSQEGALKAYLGTDTIPDAVLNKWKKGIRGGIADGYSSGWEELKSTISDKPDDNKKASTWYATDHVTTTGDLYKDIVVPKDDLSKPDNWSNDKWNKYKETLEQFTTDNAKGYQTIYVGDDGKRYKYHLEKNPKTGLYDFGYIPLTSDQEDLVVGNNGMSLYKANQSTRLYDRINNAWKRVEKISGEEDDSFGSGGGNGPAPIKFQFGTTSKIAEYLRKTEKSGE